MKFDNVIMNPPFANGLHEKFLLNMLKNSKHVVSVQPLSFLLGKRQNKKITEIIDNSKTDIEQIDGNEFFDAAIGGTMGVISVDLANVYDDIVFDGKAYSKCEEITTYSNDELLVEFKNIVEPLCKNNLDQHFKLTALKLPWAGSNRYFEENPDYNWWCIRIPELRGHKGTNDYFTLISNNENELKRAVGKYDELNKKTVFATNIKKEKKFLQFYIPFNSEKEVYNFINYVKTDFLCTCLYMNKTSMTISSGTLKHIPWFDFSDPVFSKSPSEIDDYLFKKYNISNEIRKHIEEILPDYYCIRKKIKFDGKQYNKCEEITTYSNDELLVEFKNIVEPLASKDNLNNHLKLANKILPNDGRNKYLELNPVLNNYCVKIPAIGNKASILYSKSYKQNKIDTYENIYNKELKLYFSFKSKQTAINFYNYITCYFTRMCLKLLKTNLNLGKGEMALIPWFDFSDPVFSKSPSEIDDYLFKKYNISNEIRKHIEEILPDYYGIRKKIKFDGKQYNKCEEITTYSNDELLVSILNKIGCKNLKDNVHEHVVKGSDKYLGFSHSQIINNPNINWWCVRITPFAGSGSIGKSGISFYSIITKENSLGQYKNLLKLQDSKQKSLLRYYIHFDTEKEAKNCYKYLLSDFARICLYFIKTCLHLDNGELKYIPWQDFTEEWTDEKLFKKYGITKDEIEHIYSILPNYYNIERIDLTKYTL